MPFTIGGDWIPPNNENSPPKKTVVFEQKKRGKWVTLIKNYSDHPEGLKKIASMLKKQLHCGGTVKEGVIELQGALKEKVLEILKEIRL